MSDRDERDQSNNLLTAIDRLFKTMTSEPVRRRRRPTTWDPFDPSMWTPFNVRGMIGVKANDKPLWTYTFGPDGFEIETDTLATSHIDVEETIDKLRVVADLPGVTKADIDLRCDGRTLTITAEGESRHYDEYVQLPTRVEPETAVARFNNGVLAVTFDHSNTSSSESIGIE